MEYTEKLGYMEIEDDEILEDWREAFPDITPENKPGRMLRAARDKEDLTQAQLSEMTGIRRNHISEMENNKRPIGKKNAKLFAKALNISYRVFL